MVDYRKFLAKADTRVLPYVGGDTLDAGDRVLRLSGTLPERHGWYEVDVSGRQATVKGRAEAPDLSALPKVRGWLKGERIFRDGGVSELVELLPEEEPALFSPVVARRWSRDVLVFDTLEFESEAEGACREALGERRALKDVKGVPAPLRGAYGLSLLEAVSQAMQIRFSWQEVRLEVGAVADAGVEKAEAVLRALEAERDLARRELAELERQALAELARLELEQQRQALREQRAEEAARAQAEIDAVRRRLQRWRGGGDERVGVELDRRNLRGQERRAAEALQAAGARLETLRRLANDQLEVVFRYEGERFISIVDAATLQVIDSGICLGHPPRDDLVTLESLPGVIQEAMDTGRLVILRWP
ncbi:MAG: hypothetical protein MUC96_33300 [Myxococcaceae bacterium]|jgi:hypothetical protein|nr:hypothetical protein [Myxococcaceae bacterium]